MTDKKITVTFNLKPAIARLISEGADEMCTDEGEYLESMVDFYIENIADGSCYVDVVRDDLVDVIGLSRVAKADVDKLLSRLKTLNYLIPEKK